MRKISCSVSLKQSIDSPPLWPHLTPGDNDLKQLKFTLHEDTLKRVTAFRPTGSREGFSLYDFT